MNMQGQKRKRSAKYYKKCSKQFKSYKSGRYIEPGMRGFLLTCNNHEKEALHEAYSLLNEYATQLYGEEKITQDCTEEDSESEEDIDKALKKEVTQIKAAKKAVRRFQQVQSGAKNVLFINTTLEDPDILVDKIIQDIVITNKAHSRHIMRLLPVSGTCRVDSLKEGIKPLMEKYFAEPEGHSFCINTKIRNNDKVKKTDLLHTFIDVIKDISMDNSPDYVNGEYTINVDVIRAVVCVSVVKNFSKFRKYNLQEIAVSGLNLEKKDRKENEMKESNGEDNDEKTSSEGKGENSNNDVDQGHVECGNNVVCVNENVNDGNSEKRNQVNDEVEEIGKNE